MATSKTLTPTNVTIQIPAMADLPDASVFSNCVDKLGDAVNALNSTVNNKTSKNRTTWGSSLTWSHSSSPISILAINSNLLAIIWEPSTDAISMLIITTNGVFTKTNGDSGNNYVDFGTAETSTTYRLTRNGSTSTIEHRSGTTATISVYN